MQWQHTASMLARAATVMWKTIPTTRSESGLHSTNQTNTLNDIDSAVYYMRVCVNSLTVHRCEDAHLHRNS